jgi:hypothetical protein
LYGLKSAGQPAEKGGMEGDPALQRLYDRYRVVVAAHRSQKHLGGLAAAEAVIQARVMLYEHLVATGWDPPEELRRQLELDALLLEQDSGELSA